MTCGFQYPFNNVTQYENSAPLSPSSNWPVCCRGAETYRGMTILAMIPHGQDVRARHPPFYKVMRSAMAFAWVKSSK